MINIFKSLGVKRKLASLVAALLEIIRAVPGAEPLVPFLEYVAGALGATGVGQATIVGTVSKAKIATASSMLSTIIAAAHFVPNLQPYVPILQKLAAILGAIALGIGTKK